MTQTPPPVPSAPPTPDLPQQPIAVAYAVQKSAPVWPKVIGIISLVLAGLKVAGVLLTFGLQFLLGPGRGNVLGEISMSEQVVLIAGLLVSVVMMVAAIQLLRRRKSSRFLFIGYACASIPLAMIVAMMAMGITWVSVLEPSAQTRPTELGSVAVRGLIGLAFPVFVLVWFSRRKIREQIAEWQ